MVLSPDSISSFQTHILSWYAQNKRDLPWRSTDNPYLILLSEMMSQQTQIGRVVQKYNEWIAELPTLSTLAHAPQSTVLRLWSGLGYNRRALFLHKTAKEIEKRRNWPQGEKEFLLLPGIGKYTASALLCFAFHKQISVIDTNIRKVITVHFFSGVLPSEKEIEEVAAQLVPKGRAEEWNQALMDYAGVELKQHKIPIPKQSKLLGSDRYYRGKTLKYLVKKEKETREKLLSHFVFLGYPCEEGRYEKILLGMEKEGFIHIKGEEVFLA